MAWPEKGKNSTHPPGGSLGTPKILSTGATLHVGPIRLHVENWECRALIKIFNTVSKILRAVPIFLARVNEVLGLRS